MKERLITSLVQALLAMLSPDLLVKFADMVLDFAEEYVDKTDNTLDNAIVEPLCATIRSAFNIPDDDE